MEMSLSRLTEEDRPVIYAKYLGMNPDFLSRNIIL